MRTTLEFDADNLEEVARVLDTVIHLAKGLELPIPTAAVDSELPPSLLSHNQFRVTATRQAPVREMCSVETAEREATFKPAPGSGAVGERGTYSVHHLGAHRFPPSRQAQGLICHVRRVAALWPDRAFVASLDRSA